MNQNEENVSKPNETFLFCIKIRKVVLKQSPGFSNIKPTYIELQDFVDEYNDKGFSDICNAFTWQDIAYVTGNWYEKRSFKSCIALSDLSHFMAKKNLRRNGVFFWKDRVKND